MFSWFGAVPTTERRSGLPTKPVARLFHDPFRKVVGKPHEQAHQKIDQTIFQCGISELNEGNGDLCSKNKKAQRITSGPDISLHA